MHLSDFSVWSFFVGLIVAGVLFLLSPWWTHRWESMSQARQDKRLAKDEQRMANFARLVERAHDPRQLTLIHARYLRALLQAFVGFFMSFGLCLVLICQPVGEGGPDARVTWLAFTGPRKVLIWPMLALQVLALLGQTVTLRRIFSVRRNWRQFDGLLSESLDEDSVQGGEVEG